MIGSLLGVEHVLNESILHVPIEKLLQIALKQAKTKNFGPKVIKAAAKLLGTR